SRTVHRPAVLGARLLRTRRGRRNRGGPVSRECCGPEEQVAPEPVDDCCGPSEPRGEEIEELPPWWRDRALALPVAWGLRWAPGMVRGWTSLEPPALVAFVPGLAAGAWTFAPGTIRNLFTAKGRGRLGVGLLMTIAATGAVLLGHFGEAAALAFLFSIA